MKKNPVIQSDLCRLMLLCEYGGMYIDSDVSFKHPFESGVETADLTIFRDSATAMTAASHIIAAANPNQRCICNAATSAAKNVWMLRGNLNFKARPHLVHEVAGPNHLTAMVSPCVPPPYRSADYFVSHVQASEKWANDPSYFSWTKDRMQRAGWTRMFEH
mgnify:FL=1